MRTPEKVTHQLSWWFFIILRLRLVRHAHIERPASQRAYLLPPASRAFSALQAPLCKGSCLNRMVQAEGSNFYNPPFPSPLCTKGACPLFAHASFLLIGKSLFLNPPDYPGVFFIQKMPAATGSGHLISLVYSSSFFSSSGFSPAASAAAAAALRRASIFASCFACFFISLVTTRALSIISCIS